MPRTFKQFDINDLLQYMNENGSSDYSIVVNNDDENNTSNVQLSCHGGRGMEEVNMWNLCRFFTSVL